MAYIGVQPKAGQYRKLDDISSGFNGTTTTFTTSVDGDNVTATAPQQLLVSVGGVIQQPNVDYTTSTNSITFTTAPASGLSFFAILMGDAVNIGTPSDGSVTTAKLVNDSVTTAKLDSTGIAPIVTSLNGGPLSGTRNRIINGDMRIDQRNAGASVSTTASFTYTVDRWLYGASQASKFTVQRNAGSVTPPAGFTNYAGITSSSAYSPLSSDYFGFIQNIEGFNTADLAFGTASAKTVTLSFWVRSSLTGDFGAHLNNNGSTRSYYFRYNIPSANTWTYISKTITGDTSGSWSTDNSTGLAIWFDLGSGSASQTSSVDSWTATGLNTPTSCVNVLGTNGATWYITGVQLEAGTVATPFERRSYGQELALCQRYYEKSYEIGTVPGAAVNVGSHWFPSLGSTANTRSSVAFRAVKRIAPTVSVWDTAGNANCASWANSGNTVTTGNSQVVPVEAVGDSGIQLRQSNGITNAVALGYHWAASAEL